MLIQQHSKHLEDFNLSEIIAHRIAYAIAKNPGQVKKIIINDIENKIYQTYSVEEIYLLDHHQERISGLKGAFLIPDHIVDVPTLRIVWAGTHGPDSARLNSEITPGEESYRRSEDQILKFIIEKLVFLFKKYERPIQIILSGHSLGGALSQLTFHSLQRIMILNSKDQEIAKEWELEFRDKLKIETSNIEHHRSLLGIKFPPDIICKMALEVWNSPGVLESVADHSNRISTLLVDNNVRLKADYGMVHGDVVQTTGRKMLLSDVKHHKVAVRLLKIQPNALSLKTKTAAGIGAISVGRTIGAAAIGGPAGAVATAVTLGGMTYASISKMTMTAHKMHHFLDNRTPQCSYILLTSHCLDNSVNLSETGWLAICEELNFKSNIAAIGAQALSRLGITEARANTSKEKDDLLFNHAIKQVEENKSSNTFMTIFITEMEQRPLHASDRILKMLDEKNLSVNIKDESGKSLLHYAVERNCVDLVKKLLERKTIDVNMIDRYGNTPLLTCLLQASIYYEIGLLLLAHPCLDIHVQNYQGISVRSVHDNWRFYGAPGSYAREFCLKLKSILDAGIQPNSSDIVTNKYLNFL